MFGHRDPRCSYTASRGVHFNGQLNAGDHPKYRQKPSIAVVFFSEHAKVNRGDGCSNEGSALAVLYVMKCSTFLIYSGRRHVDYYQNKIISETSSLNFVFYFFANATKKSFIVAIL